MLPLVWILLASSTRVELINQINSIPAGKWRFARLALTQLPAQLTASYQVQAGDGEVRLALLRSDDLNHLEQDLPYGAIEAIGPGRSGTLHYVIQTPGEYAVVIDNQLGAEPASVELRVWQDSAGRFGPGVTTLSPERRRTVVAISLLLFIAMASYAGRRLLPALRR